MSFFQKTILKKYQAMLPREQFDEAWQKYQPYFLNPEIQENIRHSKEEQFQEGFLREFEENGKKGKRLRDSLSHL